MKKRVFMLLFAIGMLLALCVSANAAEKNVGTAAELKAAVDAGGEVTIKLTNYIYLSSPLTVPENSAITLDLNCYKLTYAGDGGSIITVKNAALTIMDSGAVYSEGVLIKCGWITSANKETSENGGGLYIDDGGTVVLQDGWIHMCAASGKGGGAYVAKGGKLRITGGQFAACKAPNGGGVYVDTGGTVEMSAGSLSACEANGNTPCGGGAYINAGGTFTMTGGQIASCTASGANDVYGGGVYVASRGNLAAYGEGSGEKIRYGFRMSGSTIQSCTAISTSDTGYGTAYGGGVYVGYGEHDDGIFEMGSGSNILDCRASAPFKAYGGGVYVNNTSNGLFKMDGGKFSRCEAVSKSDFNAAHGGGVCVKNGVFEMNGGEFEASCKSTEAEIEVDGGVCIGCDGSGTMQANGGTVNCAVENHNQIECTNPNGSTIFNAAVKNDEMHASITGGTFRGDVDNRRGSISGGEFYGTVDNGGDGTSYSNGGYIYGGVFHGEVKRSCVIGGGTFDSKPEYAFTVTFVTRGGEPVPEQQYRLNAPATKPTEKVAKNGQELLGWCTDEACTQLYNFTKSFAEQIRQDTTLYALWSGDRCDVRFDSDGGSLVNAQLDVVLNAKAAEPEDPTKDGATFLGWFTASGKHWNFTHDLVTESITLTAKWADGGTPTPPSTIAVTGVTLDKTTLTLAKGKSETLTAAVKPEDATNKTVSWSSTDASVAAVNGGTVTAGKAGMALIIVRTADSNHIAVCTVTVTEDTLVETCTVSFDANGGTGVMDSVSVQKGSSCTLPACRFTAPDGMEFDAWQIGGARYGAGALYPVRADTAVKALWKSSAVAPGTCAVSFDANGGTGVMDAVRIQTGSSFPLPICGFTAPAGKQFQGWALSADGAVLTGSTVNVTAAITLYAIWEEIPAAEVTISFDENGGTGSMAAESVRKGSDYSLPACGFTAPAGKRFKGWALSADGAVLTGSTVNVTAAITLYAIWEDIPTAEFTVTFDGNGGTPAADSMQTTGQRLAYLPGASRSEHSFDGWYTERSGGTRITTQTVFPGDTTVYAHWTYTGGSGGWYDSAYTIRASAGTGGSVTPSGNVSVRAGADQTFIITPDRGYAVSDVRIDGRSIGAVIRYTFENVRSSHTIEVSFRALGTFADVPSGSYYEEAVSWAAANGITAGTDAAHFSPDSVCTRAQAVTFLYRAAGSPAPKTSVMPFKDVPAGSYYYDAVLWAVENGITKGTGEAAFSPDETCTRAQIVSFLYRMIQSEGGGFTGAWMFRLPFTDAPDWAYEAIAWCYQKGITAGTTATTFSPNAPCTRAQIVTFLWRCKK